MVDWVKLTGSGFSAADPKPHWPDRFSDPEDFVNHIWGALASELQVYDIETACELAAVRGDSYDALKAWGETNVGQLNDSEKLMIADVILRPRPRSSKGKHDQRNAKLRLISDILRQQYGFMKKDVPAFLYSHVKCNISEQTITDILD